MGMMPSLNCKPEQLSANERHQAEVIMATQRQRRKTNAAIPVRLMESMQSAMMSENTPWAARFNQLCARLGDGYLIGLIGGYGTGKSQLGSALVVDCIERDGDALFVAAPDMTETIKDVYRADDGTTVAEKLKHFRAPQLLVIDELNDGISEADIRYLHRIVCQRYDDKKDTLIISNEHKAEFELLVGDRLLSRMTQCGGIITANWPSFRKQK